MLQAVQTCRTAEAGAHLHVCDTCGYSEQSYNSCRDRHCPNCQWPRQRDWIDARMEAMLPVGHFHVVFTIPSELRALAAFNPEVVYDRLLRAAAETILAIAKTRLGLRPGITVVLHTWTREMLTHPHVHCIVSAGGEDLETGGWKAAPKFLAHVEAMAALFKGKLLGMLKATPKVTPLTTPDDVSLRDLLAPLHLRRWVVFVKAPLDNHQKLVRYLGSYTHRVAISNSRIVRVDEETVTFRTRRGKTITISHDEFIERFLAHVLPKGFRKIRHYGLYAPGSAARLEAVGNDYAEQLDDLPDTSTTSPSAGLSLRTCPCCKQGTLRFTLFVPTAPACNDSS